MKKFLLWAVAGLLISCNGKAQQNEQTGKQEFEVNKSETQWKEELSDAEYRVLRKGATERTFSSELNEISEPGVFVCAACGNELYLTEHKFDSGTGWPSFDRAIEGAVAYGRPLEPNEVHCSQCGSHLGHVFEDGPRETTGKRHCINGIAMDFIPAEEKNN